MPKQNSTEDKKTTELLHFINEEGGKYYVKGSPTFRILEPKVENKCCPGGSNIGKTTQKLINSTIIPLLHRCQLNRMFDQKTLGGILSTETMDGKCK